MAHQEILHIAMETQRRTSHFLWKPKLNLIFTEIVLHRVFDKNHTIIFAFSFKRDRFSLDLQPIGMLKSNSKDIYRK